MLGTIEELEKDIEKFQENIAASNELQTLLKQMLEQIEHQNADFNSKSMMLLSKVETLPSVIETANTSSNNEVKQQIEKEINRALDTFTNDQKKYLQELEQTQDKIKKYIEQSQASEKTLSDGVSNALIKFNDVVDKIIADNKKASDDLKVAVDTLLQQRNATFIEEQNRYISVLQQTQSEIKESEDKLAHDFESQSAVLLSEIKTIPGTIHKENEESNNRIKSSIAEENSKTVNEFKTEQIKYFQELQQLQTQIKNCEDQFESQSAALLSEIKTILETIRKENEESNDQIKKGVAEENNKAVKEFKNEQEKYLKELQQIQTEIKKCEEQLDSKYAKFLSDLEKTNISNLYDQNVQIQKTLNTRTMILTIISIISVAVAVVGIVF